VSEPGGRGARDKISAMKIILSAVEPSLSEAWKTFCGHLENVTLHQGSILDLAVGAVVSPANSFGFMDGGIDLLYSHAFGWHVRDRHQKLIRDWHHSEFLVGTAEIVETGHPRIPYLIAAPTMRVPMILGDSVNPYLAARAALLLGRGIYPATWADAQARNQLPFSNRVRDLQRP